MISTGSITFDNDYTIELEFRNSFFQKLQGLLGKTSIKSTEGIVLTKCKQIHTFGMKFPIDIVVLDKDFKIIDFISDLKANKISPYYRRSYYIIELATNSYNKNLFKDINQLTLELC